MAPDLGPTEAQELVFCYGADSAVELQEQCRSSSFDVGAARLDGYVQCFAGWSTAWDGAVASIIPQRGGIVHGSVACLSDDELQALDRIYCIDAGACHREEVTVVRDGEFVQALVRVLTDANWEGPPSERYLAACKAHMDRFWQKPEATIAVRDTMGMFIAEWAPPSEIEHLFVYGSLRPDDDSRMPWTRKFIEGMEWMPAKARGPKLYRDTYATAVLPPNWPADADHSGDVVIGCLLWAPDAEAFAMKMLEADRIEGYPKFYQRSVVQTERSDGGPPIRAWMYHRRLDQLGRESECIASGDWLRRAEAKPPWGWNFFRDAGDVRSTVSIEELSD